MSAEEVAEVRLAEKRVRWVACQASGWSWLPAVEEVPEDVLVHGVMVSDVGMDGEMVMGDCMASMDNGITEEDAWYVSLFAPTMAIPIADWLSDAAHCMAAGGSSDEVGSRMLRRALFFARKVNQQYRRIQATGIHEKRVKM